MSIDHVIWVPAGARNDTNIGYRKYYNWREVPGDQKSHQQVFLAHIHLIDEQYLFESADDARWFWDEGYKERLYLDDQGTPMSYDRMTLWIDGRKVDSRGYDGEEQQVDHTRKSRPDGP
jgi:hypothetical protein